MKKGSKKSILVVVLLLLVGVTAYFAANTYAKYISYIDGNTATATVAKWAFYAENETKTFTIALDDTVDVTTLYANRIAPGTSGSFNIELTNGRSEVGVDFTLQLTEIPNQPTNLKFYREAAHTTVITPDSTEITGQIVAGDSTGVTVPIYWAWEYETQNGDAADTQDGEDAATLTIGLTITGVQTEPDATAITSHVN